ncbi:MULTISPECIES: DUF805 domain-containing protein [Streptomyces]|uniref:DUF805 domain-containing protein n=1 Tax=Streptomyces maoxianensis TaxID=1459942 RepID=A0ABV9G6T0_9ACTN|nr:DUF805 domain-containing protein [Streptomyces sp. ISL-1]MBT2394085.1 DUF805 domain-containing protein [Streptomyces sp. ISL-1]
MHWYLDVLKKYAVFSGRARRQEYWMFALISTVISIALTIIDNVAGTSPILGAVYSLVVLLPGIGVSIRRLHDTDRSGWWLLISLVPFVGVIILIVFLASEGKSHENSHGPNPKLVPAH